MWFSLAIFSADWPIVSPVDGSAMAGETGTRSRGRIRLSVRSRAPKDLALLASTRMSARRREARIGMSESDSTPPASTTSASPSTISSYALATACPEDATSVGNRHYILLGVGPYPSSPLCNAGEGEWWCSPETYREPGAGPSWRTSTSETPFSHRTRAVALASMSAEPVDILVIGGGITGAGIARDAALRGFRTAVVDKGDLGGGTSSLASRLVHGGIRYLEQGQFRLVFEASRERRVLLGRSEEHTSELQSPMYL